jgi:hypothetical protein
VRALDKGLPVTNDAAPWIEEYVNRHRLAKLGFTTDTAKLDAMTAEVFVLISQEIDKLDMPGSKRPKRKR